MKNISLKMGKCFKVTLLSRNNCYELENNAIKISVECDVDDTLAYKMHISHGGEKTFILMDQTEDGVEAVLTSADIPTKGIYYIQFEGVKEDYRIISNQIRLELGGFINAEHVPTPEEQSVIDKLLVKVTALSGEVKAEADIRANADANLSKDISELSEDVRQGFINVNADIATKANRATVDALSQIVASKADSSTVASAIVGLSDDIEKKADKTTVTALASEVETKASKTSVDNVTRALEGKQDILVAGENITINGNVISATGGGGGKDYVAGEGIDITDNVISSTIKEYDDTEIRTDVADLDAKIKDLELFKYPNVTIIGTPIVNNGQISGFSDTSYLRFPFLVDFRSQAFEINMCFTTGANVTNQENIFDSDFGLAFAIRSGRFVIAISTNGTNWDMGEGVGSHVVQPNTTYYVKLSWDKTRYDLSYSFDGVAYTSDIVKVGGVQPYPKPIFIGVGENFVSIMNHFSGTINLNNANLKINGEVVWSGMDDAGLSTRADVSLSNIDADGEQRIKDLASGVSDVQVNGTSVVKDGVANIPMASSSAFGTIKVYSGNGFGVDGNGNLMGSARTMEQYSSASNNLNISKGTLENVLDNKAIRVDKAQSLTEEQKAQARANIGILSTEGVKF